MARLLKRTRSSSKKIRNSAKTRRKILAAAEKVFAKKGLAGARTHEIAALAGINAALLHRYFTSKENLYLRVIKNALQRVNIVETLISSPRGSYPERISYMIDAGFNYFVKNKSYLKLIQRDIVDGGYGAKRTKKDVRSLVTMGIKFFQEGIDKGHIEECDPRDLVFTIFSLIIYYFFGDPILKILWGENSFSTRRLELRKNHIKFIFNNLLVR